MSILKFPYRRKTISLGEIVDPLIQAQVKASYGWQPVWFLVDTGADVTTLTVSFAKQLGINLDKRKKSKVHGIGNQSNDAYQSMITLKLNGIVFDIRAFFLNTPRNILLLGRLDLFDKFDITFKNSRQELHFESF